MATGLILMLTLLGLVSGYHALSGEINPRLGANVLKIIQIEKYIEKIKDRLKEARHVDVARFVNEVDARLSALEGTDCEAGEFQCGGDDSHECISGLFVCDGQPDCYNHHDEDDDVCSLTPVQPGRTYSGMMRWTSCLEWGEHPYSFRIVSVSRLKGFRSRVFIKARETGDVLTEDGDKVHFEVALEGTYNFVQRRLQLYTEPSEGEFIYLLYLDCNVTAGDFDRLLCHYPFEGSDHVCATGQLHLERSRTEHDHGGKLRRTLHSYYDTTKKKYLGDHKDEDHHREQIGDHGDQREWSGPFIDIGN